MSSSITDSKLANLTEFSYSKFCSHYSKRNWLSNEPLWNELCERDRQFWRDFVVGIRSEFNPSKIAEEQKKSSEPKH